MKRIECLVKIFISILLFFNLCGCIAQTRGSGNIISYNANKENKHFNCVKASDYCEVNIKQGESYKVTVNCDDNIKKYVKTEIFGDALYVSLNLNNFNNCTCRVNIVMPEIKRLELENYAKGEVSGNWKNLRINLNDYCYLIGKGSVDNLSIDCDSYCKADLLDLTAENAAINAEGYCTVSANVKKSLSLSADRYTSIKYSGKPKIDKYEVGNYSTVKTLQNGALLRST